VLALPVRNLTVLGHVAYLNTEFDEFNGFREEDRFQMEVDFSGNRLPRAPEVSGRIAVQYDWDLNRFGVLSPRVQFYGSSDLYFRAANDASDRQEEYTRTDIRLKWSSSDGRFGVEGFVDNVTD
jgi:iron complex outermembrane receptor protein